MTSPFPGMDPYLEDLELWPGFQQRMLVELQNQIAGQLPSAFAVAIEDRISLAELDSASLQAMRQTGRQLAFEARPATPGVPPALQYHEVSPKEDQQGELAVNGMLLPQVRMRTIDPFREVREPRLVIRRSGDRRCVTYVELLSPHGKTGSGRLQYVLQRRAALRENIHVVELDLLVGGEHLPLGGLLPNGHYYVLVNRATHPSVCDVYAWTLRDRLPTVPIPLRSPEAELSVDLNEAFLRSYRDGHYRRTIDYRSPPGAFSEEHWRTWCESVVAESLP